MSRTVSDGRGWSSTTNFSYGAIALSGDEFLGHSKVRAIDPLGNYTDSYFHQDVIKKGRAYQVQVYAANGALFNQTNNTFTTINPYSGVTFVALTQTDNYECEGQGSCHQTAEVYSYDSYGNPTQKYSYGDVPTGGDERSEITDWIVDINNWLHRPARAALYDAGGALMRERWMYYDNAAWGVIGNRGLLTKEESRLAGDRGNAGNPTVIYNYDVYGNRTSTTDPRGCTTTTVFGASQTYPSSVTNCLNHSSSMVYDQRFGVMTSQTDANNQTTTSTYDFFGRPTKVTGPLDGGSTYGSASTFYLDWGNPNLQRVTTFRTEQHGTANYIWSEEYFDGLGRTYLNRQEGPSAQAIQSETTFDARGLTAASSAPRFSTETAKWTQMSYDPLGRQSLTLFPDGTHTQNVYDHHEVTVTDPRGNIKRTRMDSYHRVAQVEEVNGGASYFTNYYYDAADALIKVTNAAGHNTLNVYDYLGRKLAMCDPNMGTASSLTACTTSTPGAWVYTYNLAGDLVTQKDAKNQTLTFTYDSLGRTLTKKQGVTSLVAWTYDDATVLYSKGRVTQIVDQATTTKFAYDQLGRTTQTQRQLLGVWHTMSQTYDALSRITSETFPDNEVVSYSYNTAGWLSAVPGYINNITYNARGQKTQMQYANGVTTDWTFNANNFRVNQRATYLGTLPPVRVALSSWVKSWTSNDPAPPPAGFANLYRGGICTANSSGVCIGGDATANSGVGAVIGYLKNSGGAGTVPAYQSTCYNTGGACLAWGLSLDLNGSPAGYFSTTAPDGPSSANPFIQSNGVLLQGLTGTPSAYLWSIQTQLVAHSDHFYATGGNPPTGYGSQSTTGYLEVSSATGTAPLYRYFNSSTGYHYYSTINDQPSGFSQEALLGYLRTASGSGLTQLYRHYNATSGDYLLNTSVTPPSGYVMQANLGYIFTADLGASGVHQDLVYNYDNSGNVTSIDDYAFSASRVFSYDALNRITQAVGFFGQNQALVTHDYSYNAIGNILTKGGVAFTYGDAMHPSAVTAISSGKTYTYDANGNMLSGANRTFVWDIDNRVTSVAVGGATTSMYYDYSGARVRKDGSGISLYPFQGYEIDPAGTITKFIRVGGESIASKKGTSKYFYHNDHLGSVNVVTDINGTRVQLNEYDPWGAVSRSEGSIDPDQRFTGQKLDPETGLYYYGGRYYDAEIGRFNSADPFVQTIFDPQNLNRYSYVVNNPQNYIDPSGYFHQLVKKKKHGGFFNSIFGSIFRIFLDIVFLAVGLPPGADFANVIGTAVAIGDLGQASSNLMKGADSPGGGSGGGAGPQIPGMINVGGGGFFSPALRLAMADTAGCDVCEDPVFSAARIGMWFDFEGGFGGRRGRLRGIAAGGTAAQREEIFRGREARARRWGVNQVEGKGSTADPAQGSTLPRNIREQLAINQAISHPEAGQRLPINMIDPRWPASEGWVKMQQIIKPGGEPINVHYVRNPVTGAIDDFKIIIRGQ